MGIVSWTIIRIPIKQPGWLMESIRIWSGQQSPESFCPRPSNVLTAYISIFCCLGAFTAGLCGGHFCSRGGNNISWGVCKDVGFMFQKYLVVVARMKTFLAMPLLYDTTLELPWKDPQDFWLEVCLDRVLFGAAAQNWTFTRTGKLKTIKSRVPWNCWSLSLRIMGSQIWLLGDPRTLLYRFKTLYRRVQWFLKMKEAPTN